MQIGCTDGRRLVCWGRVELLSGTQGRPSQRASATPVWYTLPELQAPRFLTLSVRSDLSGLNSDTASNLHVPGRRPWGGGGYPRVCRQPRAW